MRYQIEQGVTSWVIWDSKLLTFLGDGKGGVATFETWDRAQMAVDTMVQRVEHPELTRADRKLVTV